MPKASVSDLPGPVSIAPAPKMHASTWPSKASQPEAALHWLRSAYIAFGFMSTPSGWPVRLAVFRTDAGTSSTPDARAWLADGHDFAFVFFIFVDANKSAVFGDAHQCHY